MIAGFEQHFGRPLQWLVCQLHGNELHLMHLLIKLDGPTTGQMCFTGKIGKKLQNCEQLPVVDFEALPTEVIDINKGDLCTDLKYLVMAYNCVSSDHYEDSFPNINPRKLNHSRWLTTANRFLRLYDSSDNFLRIVKYIVASTYQFGSKLKLHHQSKWHHLICMQQWKK